MKNYIRRRNRSRELEGTELGSNCIIKRVTKFEKTQHAEVANVTGNTSTLFDPAFTVARAISDALDPVKAPSKGRSFADMTDEEKNEMRRLYSKQETR